jgi:hypothetical protein
MHYVLIIIVTISGFLGGTSTSIQKLPMPSKESCEQQAEKYNKDWRTRGHATCFEVAEDTK